MGAGIIQGGYCHCAGTHEAKELTLDQISQLVCHGISMIDLSYWALYPQFELHSLVQRFPQELITCFRYFLAVTMYYLYGETVIYYFKHVLLVDKVLLPFATHHRFIR